MAEKKEQKTQQKKEQENDKQWFLNPFPCSCETEYWFEVTEMDMASRRAPGFKEERDYLYYCHKCQKNKVVFYTSGEISTKGPDHHQPSKG